MMSMIIDDWLADSDVLLPLRLDMWIALLAAYKRSARGRDAEGSSYGVLSK